MTEQEALNSPKMKTIMLLSGYIRELRDGADYETTTYKLAETLVKVFSILHINQQSKLLLAFYNHFIKKYNIEVDTTFDEVCESFKAVISLR